MPPAAEDIRILISGRYLYYDDPTPFRTFKGNISYLIAKYDVRPEGP